MNIFRLSKKNQALYGHKVLLADRVTSPSDTMPTLSGNEVIDGKCDERNWIEAIVTLPILFDETSSDPDRQPLWSPSAIIHRSFPVARLLPGKI